MTARVISLNRMRAVGTTLIWRGLRHTLTPRHAFDLAEEIGWMLTIPGKADLSSGFRVTATRDEVTICGWDMGPATLTRDEAVDLALELANSVASLATSFAP